MKKSISDLSKKFTHGDQLSKIFIITFFIAVFNSLIFYITFTIKDNNKEIQQPSVLVQIIISAFMTVIFGCMSGFEKIYTFNRILYFVLCAFNLINCIILSIFYNYNKKNNEKDTDNSLKRSMFITSYFFNLAIFALSIFLCTKMFKSFLKC
jgi:ABC-type bacteriocin/lantibiotic exporter with double-glycine peptidase domain